MTIHEYLTAQGWKPCEDGFIDGQGDRYIDLSGDCGWVWVLKRFSSATGGDTLAELQEVL